MKAFERRWPTLADALEDGVSYLFCEVAARTPMSWKPGTTRTMLREAVSRGWIARMHLSEGTREALRRQRGPLGPMAVFRYELTEEGRAAAHQLAGER